MPTLENDLPKNVQDAVEVIAAYISSQNKEDWNECNWHTCNTSDCCSSNDDCCDDDLCNCDCSTTINIWELHIHL